MCASYGLDPSLGDYRERASNLDAEIFEGLRTWSKTNAGATIRPTGNKARNLNPIIRGDAMELAWWGYGPVGVPAEYATINAKTETLLELPTWVNGYRFRRALIPATVWFEYQKPAGRKFTLGTGELMMIGAVTAAATIQEGEVSCYSMVMREAPEHLAHVHKRSPLLIGPELMSDWLDPKTIGDEGLLSLAVAGSEPLLERVTAVPDPLPAGVSELPTLF